MRNLLRLLHHWISKEKKLPLSGKQLQAILEIERADELKIITDDEWELLRKVKNRKVLSRDANYIYQKFIRTLLIYEYRDEQGFWFEVNPILTPSKRLE